jgi:hypothetical protein
MRECSGPLRAPAEHQMITGCAGIRQS